jgi:hypothetical protein
MIDWTDDDSVAAYMVETFRHALAELRATDPDLVTSFAAHTAGLWFMADGLQVLRDRTVVDPGGVSLPPTTE